MKKLNLNFKANRIIKETLASVLSLLKKGWAKAETKFPALENVREKFVPALPWIKKTLKFLAGLLISVLPFYLMDCFIKEIATDVRFSHESITKVSRAFSFSWILLFVAVSRCLKGKLGKIIYGLFFITFFVPFVVQVIYYPYTEFFFGFNLLQSAEEGRAYIWDVVKNTNPITYVKFLIVLAAGVLGIVKFPKAEYFRFKTLFVSVVAFIVFYTGIPSMLGEANTSLEWDTWRNPRNTYEDFSNRNNSMKICGLYEYSIRDLYVTFLRSDDVKDPQEMDFVERVYSSQTPHKKNSYTGMFKGKNVIFVQLEGMDSWLITPEDTPNLYAMMNNSMVFDNHYSYYTGGGSTFNSELAVATGFITPVSFTENPYSFSGNTFPYSLPRMMAGKGYCANAFHMNTGEYYSRDINYTNWGYDNYYSLIEDGNYSDKSYQLDREIILNEFFYEKLFKQDEPFMHYIITYTTHTPFRLNCSTGKLIAAELYPEEEEFPELEEEEVARLFAAETDRMMGLLLQALEDNGLADDTVVVVFTDHYLYTLNDKSILEPYKNTQNNLINNTPFFIWSKGMKQKHIKKVNSQIDILPTVLNMMGVEYNDEWYVGKDIMDENYTGYVFFSDYSWYDGVNYVENGTVMNNSSADQQYITDVNTYINDLIQKNDLTLKYDYFKKEK